MELGRVDMVARLRASVSSKVDVVEAGLDFFAEEKANNTDAVSRVSLFSEEPISWGRVVKPPMEDRFERPDCRNGPAEPSVSSNEMGAESS
jgi:hypothetical protein